MKTLFVAGDEHHAEAIRQQLRRDKPNTHVVRPGNSVPSQRFDLIVVSDYYGRVRHFVKDDERERMDRWFEESVRVRLASPEAMLVKL